MKVLLTACLIMLLMVMTSCGKDINPISTENANGLTQDDQPTINGNLTIKDENGKIILDKSDFISAKEYFDKNHNSYNILLTTNNKGTEIVSDYTKAMVGHKMFVYLDDNLISSPMIMDQITNSSHVIGGDFSKEEVNKLCSEINNGQ